MADAYWTGYVSSKDFSAVTTYVDKTLEGVSQDRIVSITHATAALQYDVWYTAMIVLKKDSAGSATQARGSSRHHGESPPPPAPPGVGIPQTRGGGQGHGK